MDYPLENCALTSHALDQLLQLMDIVVQFLGQPEAVTHPHEEP